MLYFMFALILQSQAAPLEAATRLLRVLAKPGGLPCLSRTADAKRAAHLATRSADLASVDV